MQLGDLTRAEKEATARSSELTSADDTVGTRIGADGVGNGSIFSRRTV